MHEQVVVILPVTNDDCWEAACECVDWLQGRLSGLSILDVPLEEPAEPYDALVGAGVVRGWWSEWIPSDPNDPAGQKERVSARDRSVLIFTDIEPARRKSTENDLNDFIGVFFREYSLVGEAQTSLYLAVQSGRNLQFRKKTDRKRWRIATPGRQSSR